MPPPRRPPPLSCRARVPDPSRRPPLSSAPVLLKNLADCSVHILDHSSHADVVDCVNCQLFLGPVDGAALFTRARGCLVAVAAQQFQARDCVDAEFGLYCATAPAVAGCAGLRFSCWMGAYPGLTSHFAAASLDPLRNAWDRVLDVDAAFGDSSAGPASPVVSPRPAPPPSFTLCEAAHHWEVPLPGRPPPDNPVPAADGSAYTPGPVALAATAAAAPPAAPVAAVAPRSPRPASSGKEGGGGSAVASPRAVAAPAPPPADLPAPPPQEQPAPRATLTPTPPVSGSPWARAVALVDAVGAAGPSAARMRDAMLAAAAAGMGMGPGAKA